jgi:hypothetical protein
MMAIGGGPYDAICEAIGQGDGADLVCVIVAGGRRGGGFGLVGDPFFVEQLPRVLRGLADTIEADLRAVAAQRRS